MALNEKMDFSADISDYDSSSTDASPKYFCSTVVSKKIKFYSNKLI